MINFVITYSQKITSVQHERTGKCIMKELEIVLMFNSIKVVEWNFRQRWDVTISPIVLHVPVPKMFKKLSPFAASLKT